MSPAGSGSPRHSHPPRLSGIIAVTPKKVAAFFSTTKPPCVTSGGVGGSSSPWEPAVGKRERWERRRQERKGAPRTNAVGFVLIAAFVRPRFINAHRSVPPFCFLLVAVVIVVVVVRVGQHREKSYNRTKENGNLITHLRLSPFLTFPLVLSPLPRYLSLVPYSLITLRHRRIYIVAS